MTFTKTLNQPDIYLTANDGERYKLSPLNFSQLNEYILWYKFKEYNEAKQLGIIDRDLLKTIYERCASKDFSFTSPELIASMISPEGCKQLIFLMVKKNHPNVTQSDIDNIIDVLNYEDIATTVLNQAGYGGNKNSEDNSDQPKK